jgi:hypothetical protein
MAAPLIRWLARLAARLTSARAVPRDTEVPHRLRDDVPAWHPCRDGR